MFWHLTNLIFCLNFFYNTMQFKFGEEFYKMINDIMGYNMTGSYLISYFFLAPILIFLVSMTTSKIVMKVLDGYGIKPV